MVTLTRKQRSKMYSAAAKLLEDHLEQSLGMCWATKRGALGMFLAPNDAVGVSYGTCDFKTGKWVVPYLQRDYTAIVGRWTTDGGYLGYLKGMTKAKRVKALRKMAGALR